jgi:Ca2+-binding RTX toxin-like protein
VLSADGTAATVTVNILGTNDAPTTGPVALGAIGMNNGGRLITQAELLANAADVDSPSLLATNVQISAGGGTLTDNGNDTWTYAPAQGDTTSVTFSYKVTDGTAAVTTSATLNITDQNDGDDLATGTDVTTVGSEVFGTTGDDEVTGGNSGQTIYAGAGNDTVNAGTGGDTVYGGSGNDTILGNNGGDNLYGGSGTDTIQGGTGPDIIVGGWAADFLTGGSGADTFKFLSTLDSKPGAGNYDTIADFSNTDTLDFSSIDGIDLIQGEITGTIVDAHSIAWIINGDDTIDVYANTTSSTQIIGSTGTTAPDMQIHLTNVTGLNSGVLVF